MIFDAKTTAKQRFSFSDLPDHQAVDLEDFFVMGGVPFLVVSGPSGEFLHFWSNVREDYWRWKRKEEVDYASIHVPSGSAFNDDGWIHVFGV